MMTDERKNDILDAIALEFDTTDAKMRGRIEDTDIYIFTIDGDHYYVFESKKKAYDFCIDKYYQYFRTNKQQVIYYSIRYDTDWRDFIDTEALIETLLANFDVYTRNRYIKSRNRQDILDEVRKFPIDSVITWTNGDISKLSTIFFRHFKLKALIAKMISNVGLGEMLDHGKEYVIILHEKKKAFYLYKVKSLPKDDNILDMMTESKKIYFDKIFENLG